ncbi:hypothetical protein DMN91_004525 [Ooceraea biroi]|uniref:WAP domain-containing protein n=1 Tax=Ooceraea biroi TaxID=2015173 RepID=A0A3L8DPB9_OOCBI|nr:uncharacterized protein LOC105287617 [Ooceraea biroi]RLU22247.1 hypothetical protein DMN91_004525 [Ooceraea biroi]
MSRLLLLALLTYTVLASESCIIQDKKGKSDIHVIEMDGSMESGEPEIVALHLPDRRRREVDSQDRKSNCKKDEDCGPGAICFAHLTCVKGTWRTIESLDANAAN